MIKARWLVLPFILALAAISAYANSFSGVFLFDDIIRIVEEERVHRLWPIGALLAGERPVVDVTLAVNYALGGLNPWGYHAVNLVIHILAGLTLFGIVRRTIDRQGNEATGQQGKEEDQSSKFKVQSSKIGDEQRLDSIDNRKSTFDNSGSLIAFAVALIFLVHPLQTQSVTYIIQRGESLMGLFYLLTLYCAVLAMDSPRPGLWCMASVGFCALGMGTKAVMVTAPLMVMIYDWVFVPRGEEGRAGSAGHRRWPLYAGLCSTWVLLWLCGIGPEVLGQSGTTSHVGFSYQGVTAVQYAATQPGVLVKYLQLAFWPASLCLDYDWPVATQWLQIVLPGITIVVLLTITGWLLWRRHWLGFVGAWFFVILAPTSSIVPIKDLMFEHRMYLPLAAIITAIMVPLGFALTGAIDNRQSTIANSFSTILLAIILLTVSVPLAYATHQRNYDYHSELTMWRDVAAKRPGNARAHVGIGVEMIKSKQWSSAIESLRKAILLKDLYADAHYNFAIALAASGKNIDAVNEYLRTAQLNPARTDALINAAQLLGRMGEHRRAIQIVRQAITVKPSEGDLHYHLGNALADNGDIEGAKREFEQALRLRPELTDARINLGNIYLQQNLPVQARTQYEQALKCDPDNSIAMVNLGRTWLQQEQWEQALKTFRQVAENDPLASDAKFGAGWALARLNRREEAEVELRNALRIDPTHAGAAAELARLEAEGRSPE